MHTTVLSLTGRLTMVKKGPSISPMEKGLSILPMMKYKIPSSPDDSRLQTWAVRTMSEHLFSYAAPEQLLAFGCLASHYCPFAVDYILLSYKVLLVLFVSASSFCF
jgi:hypothetical protein